MFPLASAPIAETLAQGWDPPMVLVGKLGVISALVLLNGFSVQEAALKLPDPLCVP